jgi:hypothetical protein
MRIECSQRAYEQLQTAGIEKRLRDFQEELKQVFLYRTIWEGKVGEIVEEVRGDSPNFSPASIQDIRKLEKLLEPDDCFDIKGDALRKHPFLLAKLIFGNETSTPENFGFASEEEFAKAITAYCIGEHGTTFLTNDNYSWRNQGRKNEIHLMTHGDTTVSQIDVSGNDPLLTSPPTKAFTMIQDASPFLAGILRYAQELEQTGIPEIINWPQLIDEIRSNPWGENSYSDWNQRGREIDFYSKFAMQVGLIQTKKEMPEKFMYARIPSGNSEVFMKMQEKNLCLYYPSQKDKTYPPTTGEEVAVYTPEDLTHLLKGMYKLFARSRQQMCQMMQIFSQENDIPVNDK